MCGCDCPLRPASKRRRETQEFRCGCAQLALSLQEVGCKSHASDISHDVLSQAIHNTSVRFETQDLVDDAMVLPFCKILRSGRVLYIHIGVVCSSFSMLRVRSRTISRTANNPWGKCLFLGEAEGNQLVRNCLQLLCVCEEFGTFGSIEKPATSRIWKIPEIQKLA